MLLHSGRYADRFTMYPSSYLVERLICEAQELIQGGDPIPVDLMVQLEFAGIDVDLLRQRLTTEFDGKET